MRTLLIDGDILVYRFANAVQQTNAFDPEGGPVADATEAIGLIENFLRDVMVKLEADELIVALSDLTPNCFRLDYDSTYKEPRGNTPKPVAYAKLREYFLDVWEAHIVKRLEADDVLGIWATHPTLIPGEKIIVSVDKDFQGVPCNLYNQDKPEEGVRTITEEEANRYHMYQTLVGDRVDNYSGCPGIGPVKAERILNEAIAESQPLWKVVAATYESQLLKDDSPFERDRIHQLAMSQARLARILRYSDFDFDNRVPIDWTPIEEADDARIRGPQEADTEAT